MTAMTTVAAAGGATNETTIFAATTICRRREAMRAQMRFGGKICGAGFPACHSIGNDNAANLRGFGRLESLPHKALGVVT